ncbi:alpha-endosulfine [Drosophila virilis]|uniref:Uncharacterized protein, isoform A n=1 Tax=Drosophila virilis TaxID=7244 RepID=B4M7L1_DROVI|nr:alpha-endosulfine [Drosophila virilis]XP_015025699.1 alpha-endosulfine [Drosophila virilis]EDW62778.1 uncharacterized protein Dvir_GJ17011, isoform A [Drosophila virilis]KRF80790.1 uncharacterized protein Dvir_GJ17011, isoform B [Drosophila virilis]
MSAIEEQEHGLAGVSQAKDALDMAASRIEELERIEEKKLMPKYPSGLPSGHSVFLQKRLHKGHKFFDSGDYQMAKQIGVKQILANKAITGDIIPTPETVPVRKYSIIQPFKYAAKK